MIATFPAFAAVPARAGQPDLHVVPVATTNSRWPAPRIACCGECGRIPADPRTFGCRAANCGLIGRSSHVQESAA